MMKAVMQRSDGTKVILLALTFANLKRLRRDGLEGYIEIDGAALGVPGIEIVITAGKDEATLFRTVRDFITPETKLHIAPHVKLQGGADDN